MAEPSRRDFLKLGGIGLLSLLLPKDFARLSAEPIKIETREATYYPSFELHNRRPDLGLKFESNQIKPDLAFYEVITRPSAQEFLMSIPLPLLMTPMVSETGASYGRLIDDNTLNFFSRNEVKVAYEGVNLEDKYLQFGNFSEAGEAAGALGIDIAVLLDSFKKIKDNQKLGQKELLEVLGGALATVWAVSPHLTSSFAASLYDSEEPVTEALRESLLRVNGLVYDLHPENMKIFFRNLVMARKLQTLSKFVSREKPQKKPAISFLMGEAHTGVNDLLVLGESVTLAGFSLYPTGLLKDVVDVNGGIDAFCSTLVLPVKENYSEGKQIKQVALDLQLKEYLESRFEG